MEKPDVCYIRLYPDNPEDAHIIAGLGMRKRKGEKSRLIKDILYAYFVGEKAGRLELKSTKKSNPRDYSTTAPLHAIMESSLQLPAENPALSEDDKEVLRKNLDELSDMLM